MLAALKRRAYIVFLVMVATACADDAADLSETHRNLETLPALVASEQVHGRIGDFGIGKGGNEILIDLGRVVVPDEVVIFPARIPTEDSGGFPPGLVAEISEDTSHSQAIRLDRWVGDSPGSGNHLPFLRIAGNGASGRFVRIRILETDPGKTTARGFATLGEILVLKNGTPVALRRPATIGSSIENPPRWQV